MHRFVLRHVFSLIAVLAFAPAAMAQNFFTEEELLRVTPKARADLVEALVVNQNLLAEKRIDSRLRVAHFLAQIMTETGGLRRLDENMNYSGDRLLQVFSRRVITPAKAQEISRQPERIANWVYRNRLGNGGPETGDGWAYRGSGYIQLTGRTNFRLRGEEIGLPLEVDPELARDPIGGLKAAAAYWDARNINEVADLNDRSGIRFRVNGPARHGLEQAVMWFNRIWIGIYQNREPFGEEAAFIESVGEELAEGSDRALESILTDTGFLSAAAIESDGPAAVSEALSAFQESRGLEVTGEMNDETFYAITDPDEWRGRETLEFAVAPMTDGNASSSFSLVDDTGTESGMPIFEPELGSCDSGGACGTGEAELNAEELGLFDDASGTYSIYETAGGTFDDGDFIPFTVIGNDDREAVLNTTAFPARAITQIIFKKSEGAGANLCSGALIAPDLVLTAGHCVHGGTVAGGWYHSFSVFPGRNTTSKPFGKCQGTRLYALRGWTGSTTAIEARDYDMGAIRLDCEIGSETGWLGMTTIGDDAQELPTTVQGYAGDKAPAGRQWISNDKLRVLQTLKAFYQNDTFGGTSGSPVFSGEDFRIFCVHTNGLHNGAPYADNNACTRLTAERLETIREWLAE